MTMQPLSLQNNPKPCVQVDKLLADIQSPLVVTQRQIGPNFEFRLGDGIEGAEQLPDKSILAVD